MILLFIISINKLIVDKRIPLCPKAKAFARRSIIIFTIIGGSNSPTPAAWLSIKFFCNNFKSPEEIFTFANSPNPVVTPYTALSSLIQVSIKLQALLIFSIEKPLNFTFTEPLINSSICAKVSDLPSITNSFVFI